MIPVNVIALVLEMGLGKCCFIKQKKKVIVFS